MYANETGIGKFLLPGDTGHLLTGLAELPLLGLRIDNYISKLINFKSTLGRQWGKWSMSLP